MKKTTGVIAGALAAGSFAGAVSAGEQTFKVTGISLDNGTLNYVLDKGVTKDAGFVQTFVCPVGVGNIRLGSEAGYKQGAEKIRMESPQYPHNTVTFVMNVTPEKGEPFTVTSSWDIKNNKPLKTEIPTPGRNHCADFAAGVS